MHGKYPDWIKNSIFYEIYPQSFYDSNSDGIGDLNGIIEKLDYIKNIGFNAIWVHPFFESPFKDGGYDISDYYKVASRFGTNEDAKRLFAKAHELGLKVCFDLVVGHTSTEHEWFKKSSLPEKNEYSDRYIWTNSAWEGPGDGLNGIGGSSDRDASYVTNYFYFQPALNYGFLKPNPSKPWQMPIDHESVLKLHEDIKNIIRFWLDMGADGFRVDLAFSLVKYDDDNWSGCSAFWEKIRTMIDNEYPQAFMISEWSSPINSIINAGFHADFLLHCFTDAYNALFRREEGRNAFLETGRHSFFDKEGKGNIIDFTTPYLKMLENTKEYGYICIPTGNHDLPRISYRRTNQELVVLYAFLLTMPGIPFFYYGDEIGMPYFDNIISKEGGFNRTGSRTPMQWSKEKNLGFSNADKNKLYLPIDESDNPSNVHEQQKDEKSLLNFVKRLIKIRHRFPSLDSDGDFEVVYAKENQYPFIYKRTDGNETVIVAVNPSNKDVKAPLNYVKLEYLLHNGNVEVRDKYVFMNGISFGIFKQIN